MKYVAFHIIRGAKLARKQLVVQLYNLKVYTVTLVVHQAILMEIALFLMRMKLMMKHHKT